MDKIHKCSFSGCNSSFNRPYRLTQHLLTHVNVRAFPCKECPKSYTSKSHLDRHINTVHQKVKKNVIYSCALCLQSFSYRHNLKRHIQQKHINAALNGFVCDFCNKDFKKKNQIKSHMYQHTGVKAFRCSTCAKEFVTHYEKRKHMRNHKTYYCDVCQMQFDRYFHLLAHRKEHEPKEFSCNECGLLFKDRMQIVRHMKKHSTEYLIRHFPCPYENCGRTYSRNSNLKQHILIKHEEVTHECPFCGARLCTKAKLNNHIKLHERPDSRIFSRQYKTKATGRKERKDCGIPRTSVATKLTGMKEPEDLESVVPYLVETCMS